mmetsp:Transcript_19201/g.22194  ORF Transcript_19201/g.22194 Transcript_19201/m.22194 type:complete len:455 (+) Transcript_19201:1728-3092(+)
MCTCDPMGYAPAQFSTVPFLVLHRAFTDFCADKNSTIKGFILEQVHKLCSEIMLKLDKTACETVNKLLANIVKDPVFSLQEHVPSVPLLLSQIYVLKRAEKLEIDNQELEWVMKTLVDECDRRSLSQLTVQRKDREVCKEFLYPHLEEDIQKVIKNKFGDYLEESKDLHDSKKRDIKENSKEENVDVKMKKEPSSMFCLCEGDICKKGTDFKAYCPKLKQYIADEIQRLGKYNEEFENLDSKFSKMIDERTKNFFKYQFWFKHYINCFYGPDHVLFQKLSKKELPMSRKEAAAIVLQNLQYPKSSFKKTAIETKEFVTISDESSAEQYFLKIINTVLEKVSNACINTVRKSINNRDLEATAERFAKVEDISEAASIVTGCKKGKGDVSFFLKALYRSDSVNVMAKVKLLQRGDFENKSLFADKKVKKDRFSQKKVFALWNNCCNIDTKITDAEF